MLVLGLLLILGMLFLELLLEMLWQMRLVISFQLLIEIIPFQLNGNDPGNTSNVGSPGSAWAANSSTDSTN